MSKSTLRVIILMIAMCSSALISKAQIGYNYSQFDVGVAGAANKVYGDAESVKTTGSINFSLNYNQTPFINYILEVQAGKLEGGNALKDSTGRQFSNSFTSFLFRVQIQAGEIIDYSQSPFANAMKNLYISSGVGYIVNKVTTNRYSVLIPDFYTPGEDNSNEILIPVRVGYEFKMFNDFDEPSVKIDLGYQYNFVMGDELDGFKVGKQKDGFSQISLGVKFAIGTAGTSYRKKISY